LETEEIDDLFNHSGYSPAGNAEMRIVNDIMTGKAGVNFADNIGL
jgi:hypothetical protein